MLVGAINGLQLGSLSAFDPTRQGRRRATLPSGLTSTGLVSWYDPSDPSSLTDDGAGSVSRVADLWGTDDLTQTVLSRQARRRTDFSPNYLGFDGADDYFLAPALARVVQGRSPYTLVYVFRSADFDGNYFHLSALGDGGMFTGTLGPNYYNERTGDAASGNRFAGGSCGVVGTSMVATAYFDGAAGNMVTLIQDVGGTVTTGATGGIESVPASCWIGGDPRDGGTRFFPGILGEMFVYAQALQGSDLSNLQLYLRDKWGAY